MNTTTPSPLTDAEADRWSVLFMKRDKTPAEQAEFSVLNSRNEFHLSAHGKEMVESFAEVTDIVLPELSKPASVTVITETISRSEIIIPKTTSPLAAAAALEATSIDRIGIIQNLSNTDYHSGPGISKSGLWTIHSETPAHFIGNIRKETKAKTFGSAAHLAVLEPHLLERMYGCLPKGHNGTTVAGKAATRAVQERGQTPLKYEEYEGILKIRDNLHADPLIQKILKGAVYEQSAYWVDEETGELCRCRPDIANRGMKILADVKTCTDASSFAFSKSIEDWGYHVQDPFYSDGWENAGGGDVDAFVFIAIESTAPYLFQVYELDVTDKDQGRMIYRQALRRYADCKRNGVWPGYPGGVKTITRPKWAHDKMAFASEALS
jgi:hypothetical protein